MSIRLEIPDTQIDQIREFYMEKLRTISAQLEFLQEGKREIEEMLVKLKSNQTKKDGPNDSSQLQLSALNGYDSAWTLKNKIIYVIEKSDKPLTSREISAKLLLLDAALNADKEKTIKNISSVISMNAGKDKEFVRIEEAGKDYKYVLNDL